MRKTWALLAALLATAGAVLFLTTTPASAAAIRVMPLGDSITGSPGCWRALLWNKLQSTGYTDVDFVGTLPAQGCSVPYDGDNEDTAATWPRTSPTRTNCPAGSPRPGPTSS